jgi:hypothetical protein
VKNAVVEGTYILFELYALSPSGTTKVWLVRTKKDRSERLGYIKWFGRWRCYAFFPEYNAVFEKKCLREIADFIEDRTRDQRRSD